MNYINGHFYIGDLSESKYDFLMQKKAIDAIMTKEWIQLSTRLKQEHLFISVDILTDLLSFSKERKADVFSFSASFGQCSVVEHAVLQFKAKNTFWIKDFNADSALEVLLFCLFFNIELTVVGDLDKAILSIFIAVLPLGNQIHFINEHTFDFSNGENVPFNFWNESTLEEKIKFFGDKCTDSTNLSATMTY